MNFALLLQVSNGDMTEAVAFLTEKNAQVSHQDKTSYYQTSQVTSDRYISVGSQADTSEQLGNISGAHVEETSLELLHFHVIIISFKSNRSKKSVHLVKNEYREKSRQNCSHL